MVWLKRLLLIGLVLLAGVATWLWLTMLSPWFYERPSSLPEIEPRSHQVFVYGTLRHAPIRWAVMRASGNPQTAILEGFERQGLDLSPNEDTNVEGLLLTVNAYQLARLDRYERLGVRYERVQQTLADGTSAWVYLRLPTLSQLFTPSPAQMTALVPYSANAASK